MAISTKKKYFIQAILFIFMWIILTIFGFVITFNVVYLQASIVGSSMQPTLNGNITSETESGDFVCVNRFVLGKKNDIVAARPYGSNYTIIKRIVAVGGDRVRFDYDEENQIVYLMVNDEVYDSRIVEKSDRTYNMPYTFDNAMPYYTSKMFRETFISIYPEMFDERGNLVLAEDQVFLKGDNWATSKDSSLEGPVRRSCIVGRVDIVCKDKQSPFLVIIRHIINIFKIKV